MNRPAVPTAKAALRGEAMARRDRLDTATRANGSATISERAIALITDVGPASIAAYVPIRSECDPRAIIEWAWGVGVATALPAVADATTIVFRDYRSGDTLVDGGFGTLAPATNAPILDPEVIIAPVIAFDRSGARLGHGHGFYDRAIAASRARGLDPLVVGVAFSVQEVANIPVDPHDVHLDWIVTEKETLHGQRTL
jgi:5-formyltetrahydrofolate cyclo-ligase